LGRLWSRRATDQIELPRNDAELWRLVRSLPERQAHVVALHYVDDRSVAEIAKLLDCSEGTVKTHLHRARVSLARALDLVSEGDER
jgi:RNA polymerase sigma-70 factor (ECF subfamily)